jgi:ParB-like nuclease family protein
MKIIPVHEARNTEKLAGLISSMQADGWAGRPILALRLDNGEVLALTGSHRLAAAEQVGIEPTTQIIDVDSDMYQDLVGNSGFRATTNEITDPESIGETLLAHGYVVEHSLLLEDC